MVDKNNLPVHHLESHARKNISFDIDRFSRMHPDVRAPYPHRNLFYTVHYVEKGRGQHIIDFESFNVEPNTMFFITPGQVHFWQLQGSIQGWVIKFKEEFLLLIPSEKGLIDKFDFFHNMLGSPRICLEKDQRDPLFLTIGLMEQEYQSDSYERIENLQCYLRIFLNQIQRIHIDRKIQGNISKKPAIIKNFMELATQYFISQRGISFYADKLGISEFHLHDLIKKATGKTPGQIIRNETILEAKRSLAHTDLTVAEIGYKLGFDDPSYFSRFFKRETGVKPSSFRLNIQEKYHIFPG